jgi:hypothetical protein
LTALRLCIGRINRSHWRQWCCHHATAARSAAARDCGDRSATAHATGGAGILCRDATDALYEALTFYRAVGVSDGLAHFGLHLVDLDVLRAWLLGNVHCTTAHDSAAASAGAKFCKSHLYRHNTNPVYPDRPLGCARWSVSDFHRADNKDRCKPVNPLFRVLDRDCDHSATSFPVNVPFRGCFESAMR